MTSNPDRAGRKGLALIFLLLALALPAWGHVPQRSFLPLRESANRHADQTYASAGGLTLTSGTNTFTVIAQSTTGSWATNTLKSYLPATVNFAHDANGNLTNDGRRRFDYDPENQLIRVTLTNAAKSEFVHDGLGRRRVRREFKWTNNTWQATGEVRYVPDGGVVLQERHYNVLISTNTPQLTLTYTRGPDLSGGLHGAGGIGGLLAMTVKIGTTAAAHYYYVEDGRGNITGLIDTNRNMVARYFPKTAFT